MWSKKIMEYNYFFEAFLLLHFSKLVIMTMPFKTIAKRLGIANVQSPLENSREFEVKKIAQAISRADRRSFVKNNCYNRALTAKMMLARRKIGYTFFLGVSKTDDTLKAHAWIRSGRLIVTGESEMMSYTPVSFFSNL